MNAGKQLPLRKNVMKFLFMNSIKNKQMNTVVGVAWGGFTSEHDISKKSGSHRFQCTTKAVLIRSYNIHISQRHDWSVTDASRKQIRRWIKRTFHLQKKDQKLTFEVIINMIHGAPGENGQLSCPARACYKFRKAVVLVIPQRLTYNKRDCLAVARSLNIPTARFFTLDQGDDYST